MLVVRVVSWEPKYIVHRCLKTKDSDKNKNVTYHGHAKKSGSLLLKKLTAMMDDVRQMEMSTVVIIRYNHVLCNRSY